MSDNKNQSQQIANEHQTVQLQVQRVIVPIEKYGDNWRELPKSQIAEPMESAKGPYLFSDLWKCLSCALISYARCLEGRASETIVFHRLYFDCETGELSMAVLLRERKQYVVGTLMYNIKSI